MHAGDEHTASVNYAERRKWLRRAGLIIGLVAMTSLAIQSLSAFFPPEPFPVPPFPFAWVILAPSLIMYALLAVAWKWGLAGGTSLVLLGLLGIGWVPIMWVAFGRSLDAELAKELMVMVVFSRFVPALIRSLALVASGVLFILGWRAGRMIASLRWQ